MNINIEELLQKLEVDDNDGVVLGEAEMVLRISRAKCRNLAKGESLRSYVATDLALGKLGVPFSREALIKEANSKAKAYDATYNLVRNVLGAQVLPKGKNIEQLAVKFAGASVERSRELLHEYEEACRRTVTAEKRGLLNYTTPKYHAAAFCVATVEAKVKAHAVRSFVATEVQMKIHDLDKICVDIVRKCGLADVEHIAKAFRINPPGSTDRGEGSKGNIKGAGGVCIGDGSPATATATTRLGVPEGVPSGLPEKQLDFSAAGAGAVSRMQAGSAAGPAPPVPPVDPAASLNAFVKRVKTLESPLYSEWCRQALA